MLAILKFLNVHNFPIFQPIVMILVSKFIDHRALSDKVYLSLGLPSPLSCLKENKHDCMFCTVSTSLFIIKNIETAQNR